MRLLWHVEESLPLTALCCCSLLPSQAGRAAGTVGRGARAKGGAGSQAEYAFVYDQGGPVSTGGCGCPCQVTCCCPMWLPIGLPMSHPMLVSVHAGIEQVLPASPAAHAGREGEEVWGYGDAPERRGREWVAAVLEVTGWEGSIAFHNRSPMSVTHHSHSSLPCQHLVYPAQSPM